VLVLGIVSGLGIMFAVDVILFKCWLLEVALYSSCVA